MVTRILGCIGILWGGAIVVKFLLGDIGQGAYAAGQTAGLITGIVMLGAGIYCVTRRTKKSWQIPFVCFAIASICTSRNTSNGL
jgi:hypothetical protein